VGASVPNMSGSIGGNYAALPVDMVGPPPAMVYTWAQAVAAGANPHVPPPSITSISPSSGFSGTRVTITGTNFIDVTAVDFGAIAATSVSCDSTTTCTVTAPASPVDNNKVNVRLSGAGGTTPFSPGDVFTYIPVVTSIFPTSGFSGTRVTITGHDFIGSTSVDFGTSVATGVKVVSTGEITAMAPNASNVVNVVVKTQYGITPITCADQFEYGTAPPGYPSGSYVPLSPTRIADTRPGSGYQGAGHPLNCDSTMNVQVTGSSTQLPSSGVTAVTLNVTATDETASSFVTVYPTGSVRPMASNLSIYPHTTVANLVTVPVGVNGQISLYNNSGTADMVVDVEGYYASSGGNGYVPLSPSRIVDTRCSQSVQPTYCASEQLPSANASLTPIPSKSSLAFSAAGISNVPLTETAAVELNVTEVAATSGGYLSVYPTGTPPPTASNVNFSSHTTVANRVVVKVSPSGQVSIYNSSSALVNVVVDLGGYYTSSGSGSTFTPSSPARLLDTRCSASPQPSYCATENLPSSNASIAPLSSLTPTAVQIEGTGPVPASGVVAVVLNVTVANAPSTGYLSVYPANGATPPTISDLNWTAGSTVSNLIVVALPTDGKLDIYSSAKGSTNVIADVLGWYT
ncbi:MAG: IPT/TIG domain-containing protein, partial [Acidimicrobiales bacterium]